jgi:Lrp/AsnC family transcriptional regulator for asnA, asnC and gidA
MVLRREEVRTLELDERDIHILRSLNENARKSFRDIAKELHVSLRTASNKVKAMERAGLIQGYMPMIDEAKVGFGITALIGIVFCIDGKMADEMEEDLAKEPAVFAIFSATGGWETIVMARFKNTHELDVFIKKIQARENVETATIQVVMNVVKDEKRILV